MAPPPPTALEYTRPPLYAKQREAIFCAERYAVVEASTKSGKTVGCLAWLIEQALHGRRGQHYWWVAPIYSQAKIAYRRAKSGLPHQLVTANESEMTLLLPSGATLWFKGADKPDSLYGEDVYAAVIDEATRVKEPAWHAVRSTLTATRGPVRIIGNVKGRRNWVYHLARRAEAGEPEMRYTRITADDAVAAGVIDAAEIASAKRLLPEAVYRELYEALPSDDQGNPFGIDAIRAGVDPLGLATDEPVLAYGIDLAKSTDWTVVIGLTSAWRVAVFERWQSPWAETLERIRRIVGSGRAVVDSTGVGDPIVEHLQRSGAGLYEGYRFTAPSKQRLMEALALAIQQRKLRYPTGAIVAELEAFEYVYSRTGVTYAAPAGMHDDCVMALALAVEALGTPPPVAATVPLDVDPDSWYRAR